MTTSDSTTPTKICTGPCGRELPATYENFCPDKRGKYGYVAECRECERARHRAYHAEHLVERRTRANAYYAAHPEKNAAYYRAHREEIKAYYQANRERLHARRTAYYASPNGKLIIKSANHRYRALKKSSGNSYTPAELQAVLAAHTNAKNQLICALCGEIITGPYHIDHWIPLSQGGTNEAGNLRVMHPKCNLKKSGKSPLELGRLL